MREFATNKHADPESWKPAKLLVRLAAEGRGFEGPDVKPKKSRARAKGKSRG
jgi:hypothetical protein